MNPMNSQQTQIYLTRGRDGCALAVRSGAIAIVVDALRASTTMAALLDHGAARILVVSDVEEAMTLCTEYPDALLVGERGCERLPGFHLGNSPLEVFASPRMDGRTVIFTSSNGAQRLVACHDADRVLVGSPGNAAALVNWVHQAVITAPRPVVFVAAGRYPEEHFTAPEDEATSVYLALRLGLPIAEISQDTARRWEHEIILHGLDGIFRHSPHAARLMEIGYADDVRFCAQTDMLSVIPTVVAPIDRNGLRIGAEVRALPIIAVQHTL